MWMKVNAQKNSNDKPVVTFGIPSLDDGSIKESMMLAASAQHRDFVVMEVEGNLTREHREKLLERFRLPSFRKVALVMIGEPPADFKERVNQLKLKDKQTKADTEAKEWKEHRKRKRLIDFRTQQVEFARKKNAKIKKKREAKRKIDQ